MEILGVEKTIGLGGVETGKQLLALTPCRLDALSERASLVNGLESRVFTVL